MSKQNRVQKRGKSSKLSTLQKIHNVGQATEKRFKEAQKELNNFKERAKRRGVDVPFSIPRVSSFQTAEQVQQTIRNIKDYLKNPTVEIPSNKNRLPYKLVEQETNLVRKANRSIIAFQEKIGKEKITIGGKKQDQTVDEYLNQRSNRKDYKFTEQFRFISEQALKERVRELKKITKKNVQNERNKKARESYLSAIRQEGLHTTPEGEQLVKKIEKMSLKKFMFTLSTEIDVAFDFIYDDNLDGNERVAELVKAWGVKLKKEK